ncbi:hypothetical protein Tco_0432437 [Tanacetum coccineum]
MLVGVTEAEVTSQEEMVSFLLHGSDSAVCRQTHHRCSGATTTPLTLKCKHQQQDAKSARSGAMESKREVTNMV